MFVNNILSGIGRRLLQRLLVMFVLVVVLRTMGFFMGAEADADFRSTSSEMRAGPTPSAPMEDDLWGADSSSAKSRRSESADEDAGWGSN
jgi:hypothetical protein